MLDPERTLVIANPAARGGRVGRNWPELEARIRAVLGPVRFAKTAGPGDAATIAEEAARSGVTTVVSYGGDGTHGDVAGGLMRAPRDARPSLGVLHAGTGGDFRRMLADGHDLEKACARIAEGAPTAIDVGRVEYVADGGARGERYFLNLASVGMSGLIDRLVSDGGNRLGGTLGFAVSTLRAQVVYRPPRLRVEVDGVVRDELRAHIVCVANGRFAGGGMMFAPEARLADGLFEVVAIETASLPRMLPMFAAIYRGGHVRSSLVRTWRGREIRVTPVGAGDARMDVDGEAPGDAPAIFHVHERELRVHGVRAEVR